MNRINVRGDGRIRTGNGEETMSTFFGLCACLCLCIYSFLSSFPYFLVFCFLAFGLLADG
jgi:hypothetical protein